MDEINFAEQNINAAQDQTQDNQPNRDTTDADPTRTQEADNDFFHDLSEAGVAIAGLLAGGAGLVSGLFGGGAGSANTGGNANPLPSNSGIVATDDPVRRREDEEGGDSSDADVSDNPQIDGMNPDRTGDRITVGGVGGTGGDTQNRGMGQADGVGEGSATGGGETIKPKPYPLAEGMEGKPVTFEKEIYSLSDSAKKEIADIKTKLSEIKVSDNEPEIVAAKKAIEAEQAKFSQTKSDLQKEIQSLREQIEDERRQLHSLENGNGSSTSAESPLALKIKIDSDFGKIKTLESKIKTVDTQLNDFMKKVAPTIVESAQNLASVRLQDSLLENPFRKDLQWSQLALMGMTEGTQEYKEMKSSIKKLNDNILEFDKAKNQLLNGSGEMQARAAEYILNVNPNANVPRPTVQSDTVTIPNSSAQAGYDPTGNQKGILPGINLPGAEVSETEKGHSARPGKENYFAVDIAAPYGSPYNPVAPGIATVHSDAGLGNHVKVEHEFGVSTIYAHNSEFLIPSGTSVKVDPTTPIARVGNTGHTLSNKYPSGAPVYGGSHIHYEIHINGQKVPIDSFDWERYKNEGQSYVNEVVNRSPR